jgi:flavoprotein
MIREKLNMTAEQVKVKKRKVAWGITGGGDKIADFIEVMKEIRKEYESTVEIQVFLSKAADIVLKYYRLEADLRKNFAKVRVELNSNAPFLAAWMQMRKYEFLLIAPATSNTVAKVYTKLPNGKEMKLRVRKEEVEQVKKLERMEDVFVLKGPQKIREVFKKWFG